MLTVKVLYWLPMSIKVMLAKDYQVSFQCHFNGTQTSKQSDMEEYEDANSCYVVVSVDEFEYLLSI